MSTTRAPNVGGKKKQAEGPADENKTVMAMLPDPKAAPAAEPSVVIDDEPEYKTVIAGAGHTVPPALAALMQPPPPLPADDEPEYKTIIVSGTSESAPRSAAPVGLTPGGQPRSIFDDYSLAALSRPPGELNPPPAANQAPDEEPEYRTIIVSDELMKPPPPIGAGGPPTPPPADEDDSPKTIMVNPGASGPPAPIVTSSGADGDKTMAVFGDKTSPDGRPVTNVTARPQTLSSWPGVTDPGATSAGSTTGGAGGQASGHVGMPEAGMYINQYEIIRKLGEGGMGAVYLGRDTRLGRRVAIKFLSSTDPELTKRFVIEARATARVEHENIVSIYEVGEWGGHPFMVLQFLQGSGLEKVIPRGKPMPVPRVIEIMIPVLRALAYAHGEGIVHRDLKPDNIFITDAGVTKVLDFGIAKVVQGEDKTTDGEGKVTKEDLAGMGADKGMTRHGAVMGTMPFMSPEQWGNGVAIDHTTDIWAVGIMMFQMLSGRHPLYPMTGMELMVTGFIDEPMPLLKEKAPELPKEVCDVVDKCLLKDKTKRWSDALALLRALEPLQRGRTATSSSINVEASPYAGLSSFQEEDAGRFFGRNREVAAMSQRLRERPLMAVVGPSGVGKSSFLRAGVVPALKNSGENWDISVIRPGRNPLMALAGLLVQISGTSTSIDDEMEIQRKLATRLQTEPGYLGTALRRQARREKKNILLFVDQFEELYTLVGNAEERKAFTACISAAADDATSPMRVVVSIRSDFLDRCVEDVHFMNELSQGLFFMTPLAREGMREALVNPAEMAGYKFENETIVNEMLDHLASTSGALPLLQFTADKLWGERDPTKKILTEKSYRALGGVAGALATHADHVLEQIPGEQRALVRALFLRLVTPERTRAIVSMDELREALGKKHADVQTLIDQMVAARLLVVQTSGGGAATVEIVHESLIHGWPQLTKWLDEGQEDAAFLEQLRNASRQWGAKNRDSGLLWRGEMVEEAKRFVRRFRGNLPEVQQQFLKAVIDMSNRAARIRKVLYVTSSIVLLALLAAAAVALYIINDSRAETQKQAVAAMEAEKKATVAAEEAEKRKVEAVEAQSKAEAALEETKKAQEAREQALAAEQKAAKEAIEAKAGLEVALEDAKKAKAAAETNAKEAQAQKVIAEANMREAQEALLRADKAAGDLKIAIAEVEQRRAAAAAAAAAAEKKLKEQTGGVVEVLK